MKPLNINEALVKMRSAGSSNVRAVPMEGQNAVGGHYQIEVKSSDGWEALIVGVTKEWADGLVSQATNRVICG